MTKTRIEWPVPQGLRLAGTTAGDCPQACMIAYLDGRNSLCSITAFHPKERAFIIFTSAGEAEQTVAVDRIKWLRLLENAHLADHGGGDLAPEPWERARAPFTLKFKSGDQLDGDAIGQVCSETGWFLYQTKKPGEAVRHFVPHTAIDTLTVGGKCLNDQAAALLREKKNPKLAAILKSMPEKYPFELERKFARIVSRIAELWDTPEIDDYFSELMVDSRGGQRQGFPPEIAQEIMALCMAHGELKQAAEACGEDPWGVDRDEARKQLDEMGIGFQAQYFIATLERGDQVASELFIKGGIDINHVGENGWTPLMIASFNGNESIAKLLIEKGADIHARDNAGYSPIHWAAFNNFAEVTAILLRRGVNPNSANRYGWTPLLQAAARGHVAVVEMLLAKSAHANQCDEEGWTPLHKATANGHLAIAKLLLQAGADMRAAHRSGVTPLSLAREKKHSAILDAFFTHGTGR
ncbi:MAG: ankyrin repeat domain-containing protein [Sulfuricella sp.]|nr:ankyrin repeat domain-containing protein [Sulfuricella sp.]